MTRRRRTLPEAPRPRLEVVPMIDIMMFLLIFFVLIALRMIPDNGIAIVLPGAASAAQMPPTQVVISLDREGATHMQGRQLSLAEIVTELSALKQTERTSVVVAADGSVSYGRVLEVMDALRKAGITNVGLATKRD